MLDRTSRNEIVAALRSYMDEAITAFQFDEKLSAIAHVTKDETVHAVRHALWFHYDDCTDHKIVASKEEWDYFTRLLLLLDSNAEMATVSSRYRWHAKNATAAVLLAVFGMIVVRNGFGSEPMVYSIPFGPPSMLLAWVNARREKRSGKRSEILLSPFPSVGSLLAIRRQLPGFAKRRYPTHLADRRIRESTDLFIRWIPQF